MHQWLWISTVFKAFWQSTWILSVKVGIVKIHTFNSQFQEFHLFEVAPIDICQKLLSFQLQFSSINFSHTKFRRIQIHILNYPAHPHSILQWIPRTNYWKLVNNMTTLKKI